MTFSELVLTKNHQFCIVNKPAGIPIQPDKTGDTSLFELAEKYFKHKLYPVHRIDRPVSGLTLFAKKDSAAAYFSELFRNRKIQKTYLALIENELPQEEGTLTHTINASPLKNNKSHAKESVSADANDAVTHYKVLGKTTNYTLVELQPLTGKHHQIRAQLSASGCPIKGDVKYGARRSNKDRSICLHAWKVSFPHPVTSELNTFVAPLPSDPLWDACAPFLS